MEEKRIPWKSPCVIRQSRKLTSNLSVCKYDLRFSTYGCRHNGGLSRLMYCCVTCIQAINQYHLGCFSSYGIKTSRKSLLMFSHCQTKYTDRPDLSGQHEGYSLIDMIIIHSPIIHINEHPRLPWGSHKLITFNTYLSNFFVAILSSMHMNLYTKDEPRTCCPRSG